MTSFVINSTDKKSREKYISEYCIELGIDKFDITQIEKNDNTKNIQSIGIDEIKELHKKIFLKPIKSKVKAVILEDAHLLTLQAQNALLKVLEEPPMHTIIILGTETTESLLPTILSRCQIIELTVKNEEISADEMQEYFDFIKNLDDMKIGYKLKKAEELAKDKSKAIAWSEKLILTLRKKILKDALDMHDTDRMIYTLRMTQNMRILLKTTNVNLRFAIENTLLNLSS